MMNSRAWMILPSLLLAALASGWAGWLYQRAHSKEVVLYTGPAGKESRRVRTVRRTVAGVLRQEGIRLGEYDVVAPGLQEPVTQDMEIDVGLVERSTKVFKKPQPAPVDVTYSETLNAGEIIDVVKGKDGLAEVETETYSLNGETAFEKILRLKVLEPARKAEVIEGTGWKPKLYRLKKRARVRKIITMEATAYYPGPEDTGKWAAYGKTFSGTKAGYGVAAVDPRFMRLKTRLYVEGYGYAEASDIGGAIKGNKIDLCFDTYAEAVKFGRQKVKVYILD